MKQLQLFQECKYSFIEITFPIYPYAILYMDLLYNELKADYIIPEHHIMRFKDEFKTKI